MRRSISPTLALLCLCAMADAAAAQRDLAYSQIPWRVTGDSARRLLEQRGFTYAQQIEAGDHQFSRADGTLLFTTLQNGRLVGITVIDPARGAAVNARYQAVADSLRAALGAPDTAITGAQALWVAGLTNLAIENSRTGSAPHVELGWHGPGFYDEIERRAEAEHPGMVILSPRPPGYTIVTHSAFAQVVVDTTRLTRRAGLLRGRFRIEYVRSVGPDSALYDSAEYDMDVDCAGKRTRLAARTTRLKGQVRRAEAFSALPWETPRPDGHYERGMRALCRVAAARNRTGPTAPPNPRQ